MNRYVLFNNPLILYLQLKTCVTELSNQLQEANEQIQTKDSAILELVDILSKVQNKNNNDEVVEDEKHEEVDD